jgi:hypothetical protein
MVSYRKWSLDKNKAKKGVALAWCGNAGSFVKDSEVLIQKQNQARLISLFPE